MDVVPRTSRPGSRSAQWTLLSRIFFLSGLSVATWLLLIVLVVGAIRLF